MEKGFISPCKSQVTITKEKSEPELKAETSSQELTYKSQRTTVYWLALHALLSLLFFYGIQIIMFKGGTTLCRLSPSISIINQENGMIDLPTG